MDYRTLRPGDRVVYRYDDFDGSGELLGAVKEVAEDHVLIGADGMDLWLDDDNSYMFSRVAHKELGK